MVRLHWLVQHPTVALALKAAAASGLAFFLGSLLPPPLEDYKYYAALGAFTVVGLIVVDSVKESLRVLAAVSIGVAVAVAVQAVAWTNPLSVASAVLLCVLLGALPVLGEQRSWAPLAALFVLATGRPQPQPMALGYLVQVPLGAAIGIIVNFVLLAPLGAQDLDQAVTRVRQLIAGHMRAYADILEDQLDGPLHEDAVQRRTATVAANLRELEGAQFRLLTAIDQGQRAQRGNPRARAWAEHEATARERAEAISRCAAALGAVAVMLNQADPAGGERGRALRRDASEALRGSASAFDDPGAIQRDPDLVHRTRESLDRMIGQVHSFDRDDGLDHVLFGALALSVRQCLEIFAHEVAGLE